MKEQLRYTHRGRYGIFNELLYSTFMRLILGQLKTFNHHPLLYSFFGRLVQGQLKNHLIISTSLFCFHETGTRPTQNILSLLLHSSLRRLVQGQLQTSNHLCFVILLSGDWYRANTKHLIISASSSFVFWETGIGPTQNI